MCGLPAHQRVTRPSACIPREYPPRDITTMSWAMACRTMISPGIPVLVSVLQEIPAVEHSAANRSSLSRAIAGELGHQRLAFRNRRCDHRGIKPSGVPSTGISKALTSITASALIRLPSFLASQ